MGGVGLYRTEAIVLKASDFGEAHRLVTLLTPGRGRLRAVAKGVRRPTSRLAAALLPFTHARLLLWEGRSLDGVSQAEIRRSFRPLREDLGRMARAFYACELTDELVPEGVEAGGAFRLLLSTLGLLAFGPRTDLPLRYLELHLLRLTGHLPRLDACAACGRAVAPPARFDPAAGGCLCPSCRQDGVRGDPRTRAAPGRPDPVSATCWLDAGAAEAARALLAAPPRALAGLRLPAEALGSLGRVTEAYLRSLLQKRLKSPALLDILTSVPGVPRPEGDRHERRGASRQDHAGED